MSATHYLIGEYFYKGVGKLHAWTEKNVLEISSSNSSLSIRQRSVIFHSLWEKYATLARLKLGFEPIQNRSGLKKRPQKVLSGLSVSILHPIHPSMRPSVRPFWGVSSQRSGRTQNTSSLVCKRREKPLRGAQVLTDSLAGPNNFPSTSKTTNSDLFKASRPPGGVLWTNSHCLQRTGLRSALQDFGEADLLHPGCRCFSNIGHLKQKKMVAATLLPPTVEKWN